MFVVDSEESGIMPLSLNNVFRSNFTLSAYYCDIWGKSPVTAGHGNALSLTKRLKASLVFWKQSMNSASLGGLARRVSMPSVGGWWRERHLNQSIPFPVQDTVICWHTEGTVRKVLRLELLEIKGARKLKVFPCVGGFVCATRGPQTSGTFPAGVAAVGSMAVLGCELRAPPNLYPGLPVCCSLTCWPFLLVLLPFLPLVELFECLCSLLKPGDKHFNVIQGAVQDLL